MTNILQALAVAATLITFTLAASSSVWPVQTARSIRIT